MGHSKLESKIITRHDQGHRVLKALAEGLKDAGANLDCDWEYLCETEIKRKIGHLVADSLITVGDAVEGEIPHPSEVRELLAQLIAWYEHHPLSDCRVDMRKEYREAFVQVVDEHLEQAKVSEQIQCRYRLVKFERIVRADTLRQIAGRRRLVLADAIDLVLFSTIAMKQKIEFDVKYIYALGEWNHGLLDELAHGAPVRVSNFHKRMDALLFEELSDGLFQGMRDRNPHDSAVLLRV